MSELMKRLEQPDLTPFQRLELVMEILRSPEGCAWDRKQTHESLVPYLIEEAYEVVELIENGQYPELREELGDVLVQVMFHAQLAKERGEFTVNDAVTDVVNKLIHRHPHVFGEKKDLTPQEVRDQWEKIKTTTGEKPSVLGGLPKTMPALTMAFRLGEKAGGIGFDWPEAAPVLEKIEEEIRELRVELVKHPHDKGRLEDEIGDLLFAVASLSRKLEVEPELALRRALEKFRSRFGQMEEIIKGRGDDISTYSLEQLESLWQTVKLHQSH